MSDEYVEVTVRVPVGRVRELKSFAGAMLPLEMTTDIIDKIKEDLEDKVAQAEKSVFKSKADADKFKRIRSNINYLIQMMRHERSREERSIHERLKELHGNKENARLRRHYLFHKLKEINRILDSSIAECALNKSNQEKEKILTSESLS